MHGATLGIMNIVCAILIVMHCDLLCVNSVLSLQISSCLHYYCLLCKTPYKEFIQAQIINLFIIIKLCSI